MVLQNVCRRRLLAGTSLLALSLYSAPATALCPSGNNQTISGSTASCVTWTGGNLSVTNTGVLTGARAGASISGSNSTGTLTNSGAIRGNMTAISNTGAIGALTNNGMVSGGAIGINNNTGTIGTLTNNGSISGSSLFGIYSSGTIGTLTNNGTISSYEVGIFNDGPGIITALTNESGGSISGSAYGINNRGAIGTLTNSGAISGLTAGVHNDGGTIGALTNNGTISAITYGIYNAGNIGTLTNGGTISGQTAIYNGGALGPITNSGLIAGKIVNLASQDLTIDGGSGTIFGTLTGPSGSIGSADKGLITSTSSNVVFGGGNILLNDDIDVTGHSVIVTNATIAAANTISITGAYTQTGGGLVAQAASATSYGNLAVSGTATVANAAIVIKGSGLASGNSFTIVSSGATGSYTGDSASVIGTSGLTASVQSVGDDLVVTLADSSTPDSFTAKGLAAGGVAVPLGPVLDAINGGSSPSAVAFQDAVLVPLAQLPASQQGQAMKELAPVQSSFQAVDSAATTVLGAIEQHQQTAMTYDGETGEAAGSGIRPGTLWAQALGGTAQRDSDAAAAGYHATDFGLAAGFDHLFTPDLLGGVAVSWLRAWTQGIDSASGQASTLNTYQLTVYGTYRHGRAFVDGRVGAGWNHVDQDRSIAFLGETAKAGYDGQQYLVDALAGYDIPVGHMTVTPLAGLRWLRANTGSYTESGAGAADLAVGSQTEDSLTQELGVKASWRLATELGTLEPEVTAEWVHDYLHGPIATSGVMGGEAFAVTTPRIAADGARIGVAATLVKSDRLSFRAEYDGELRAGYQSHTGLLKVLWQF